MGQARCIGLPSLRTEAVLLQSNASPPPCRSTRPGCEWGRLGVLVCLRFAPRRCSYNRTRHPHPVGAPAPGANGRARCIGLTSLRTEAVLLQSNASPHPVGAPAPGANGRARCIGLTSLRTEAVLLPSNASPPPCRSTRPGCEQGGLGVLVCLRFAPRRCSYNRTRHPTL